MTEHSRAADDRKQASVRRARAAAALLGALLAAAGCGASAAPARSGGTPTGASFPGAAALGSLTNYAFQYAAGGVTITGEVHSPSDWQTDQPIVERHVGGVLYTQAAGTWVSVPDVGAAYLAAPYPSSVRTVVALLQLPGAKATAGTACTVAGVAGRAYAITDGGALPVSASAAACVADGGGALLSARSGAGGAGGVPWSFTVTAVGTVPTLPVPPTGGA